MARVRAFRKIGTSTYIKITPTDLKDLNIDVDSDGINLDKCSIVKNFEGKKK